MCGTFPRKRFVKSCTRRFRGNAKETGEGLLPCPRVAAGALVSGWPVPLPAAAGSCGDSRRGRRVLDGCLQTLGVTPDTRADIALALSEACANVIQHAGPGEEYEVQGLYLIVCGAAPGSRDADALNLLASWNATANAQDTALRQT